jgi:KUP system potassium uptake protein
MADNEHEDQGTTDPPPPAGAAVDVAEVHEPETAPVHHHHRRPGHGAHTAGAGLVLGALGIVYGDIGTSPLYAFREAFEGHDLEVRHDGVLGACSLTFWALVVIITIKYLLLVMRADNKGEGGILALVSLLPREKGTRPIGLLVGLGIFGTALLYGDGMITPAISVLSAVEGMGVATSALDSWVIPIAVGILTALFLVQSRGTAGIARIFGPVMLVWFIVIGGLGLAQIVQEPSVIQALNPRWAVEFFLEYRIDGFWALGSIFLVVTGGEALYADMGHFGRMPIQLGWFGVVLPGLVCCYFGQGALLLREPESIENPFFLLAPEWAIWPLVLLATCATVIASQALITGAFSLTAQAMRLDYLPRVAVQHTSASHMGQVYVPIVNWILMVACIGLVLVAQTSSALAAAYGIAVTMTMAITTLLFMGVAIERWGWSKARAWAVGVPLLLVDLSFLGAQLIKIPHGGWFALAVGVGQCTLMTTWRKGRRIVAAEIRRGEVPVETFVERLPEVQWRRVPGTAAFLFKDVGATPSALIINLRHNRVLHEQILLLSVVTSDAATVPPANRLAVTHIGPGIWQVVMTFGFLDQPDVPATLGLLQSGPLKVDPDDVTYFLGRETIVSTPQRNMNVWRERLFVLQVRTAASAARFFHLPAARVFEVGTTVEI